MTPITVSETASSDLVRLSLFGLATLLPVFSWHQAAGATLLALLFSLFILPRLATPPGPPRALSSTTGEELRAKTAAYSASVVLLMLFYHRDVRVVAAVWAMMTFGEIVAGAVGRVVGGAKLPWNSEKTWSGLAAFFITGAAGGWAFAGWAGGTTGSLEVFEVSAATALLGAVMASLPIRMPSYWLIALACGGFMTCAFLFNHWAWAGNLPYLRVRIFLAIGVSLFFALAALGLGFATRSGAACGFLLSVCVYLGYGYKSFLVLLAFFVLGSVTTRLGYAKKAARGIAEQRGGARSWREALATTSAGAFFALASLMTLRQTAFLAALVASLAEAAGDTVSSEIGQWLSDRSYLVTNFRPIRAGENGGVSAPGAVAGLVACAAVVSLGRALGMFNTKAAEAAMAGAIAGNLLDSLLGATLERRGLMTNGIVNFASTSFAGGLALALALHFGL